MIACSDLGRRRESPAMTNGKLGDIQWKSGDPLETYYDAVRQGVNLNRRRWIVKPEWMPPRIQGAEMVQSVIEEHLVQRQWQLMTDLWTKLQCGTYFTQDTTWNKPPITARSVDVGTPASGIPILTAAPGAFTIVLHITVPDRCKTILHSMGTGAESPTAFEDLEWRLQVNERFLPFGDITAFDPPPASLLRPGALVMPALAPTTADAWTFQFGRPESPTPLAMPVVGMHRDTIILSARAKTPVFTHKAFARWQLWTVPLKTVTQDGTYADYHTI